ncbi:hypothetical protein KAR10_05985, partial [bacterium]|nr:hypothetical protein [bacterium]
KDGLQPLLMTAAICAEAKEQGITQSAVFKKYIAMIGEYNPKLLHYKRLDTTLYNAALSGAELDEALAVGEAEKERKMLFYRGLIKVFASDGSAGVIREFKKHNPEIELPEIQNIFLAADGPFFLFEDDTWFMLRASGTDPVLRYYGEAETYEKLLARLNAFAAIDPLGGEKEDVIAKQQGPLVEAGYAQDPAKIIPDLIAELESQIKQVAAILGLDETQAQVALVESMDTTEVLDNFAESVGISKDAALANMIKAGLATDQGEGKFRLNSGMCSPAKLAEFIRLQVAASQNSEMVQLKEFPIRIERIITNSVKPEDFIGKLAEITKREKTNLAALLSQSEIFPTIVEYWKLTETLGNPGEDQTLQVKDFVNPKAVDYYQAQGVDVEFSLPKKTKAGRRALKALQQYWSAVWDNMARGGFNYRGMGTEQTVEQFYNDYFKPEWAGKIREFVKENFDKSTPLKAIVTNGIGANDQFMWSLVEMYNRNRKEGDPVWYHVVAARDLAKLQDLNPENTLCIDISRSGSTWEGVEIAERMLEKGFKKRITLANGGSLVEIAEANKASSLVIGMSPDIGGRNMHR